MLHRRQVFRLSPTVSPAWSRDQKGPEAGVWVIAETRDLKTRFIKIVVTDDSGRYLLPELPKADYDVWAATTARRVRSS